MKCPKCNEEIDKLLYHKSYVLHYDFTVRNGFATYTQSEIEPTPVDGISEYTCPKCFAVICTDERDAVRFMQAYDSIPYIL